jgi:hypothetical protein
MSWCNAGPGCVCKPLLMSMPSKCILQPLNLHYLPSSGCILWLLE